MSANVSISGLTSSINIGMYNSNIALTGTLINTTGNTLANANISIIDLTPVTYSNISLNSYLSDAFAMTNYTNSFKPTGTNITSSNSYPLSAGTQISPPSTILNNLFNFPYTTSGNVSFSSTRTQFSQNCLQFTGNSYVQITNPSTLSSAISNSYTIEFFWYNDYSAYVNKTYTSVTLFTTSTYGTSLKDGITILKRFSTAGTVALILYIGNSAKTATSSILLSITNHNAWNHIACTYNAVTSTYGLCLNGSITTISGSGLLSLGTTLNNLTFGNYGQNIYDGNSVDLTQQCLQNFRISNYVRYSGASYTVPTSAFTVDAFTVYLNSLNQSSAINLNLTQLQPTLNSGTLEFFVLTSDTSSNISFCSSGLGTYYWNIGSLNGYPLLQLSANGATTVSSNVYSDSGTWALNYTGTTRYTANVWNHVAFCYTGTTCAFYLNGLQVTNASNTIIATSSGFGNICFNGQVAYSSSSGNQVSTFSNTNSNFYISNFRLSSIARYLYSAYVIPVPPYSPDALTVGIIDSANLTYYINTANSQIGTTTSNSRGVFTLYTSNLSANAHLISAITTQSTYSQIGSSNIKVMLINYSNATISSANIMQYPGTTNAYISGILLNSSTSSIIPNETIQITGGANANVTTNSNGVFSYSSNSLRVGNVFAPTTLNLLSTTYTANSISLGNLTIQYFTANLITSNVTQITGTTQVAVSGTLNYGTSNVGIANVAVIVSLNETGIVTSNSSGYFNYTSSSYLYGSTYKPNITLSSNIFSPYRFLLSNITITSIPTTITTNSLTQVSGTNNVYVSGTLTNSALGTPVSNANVIITGLGSNLITQSDSSGIFSYTQTVKTLNTYNIAALVSSTVYSSNITNMGNIYTTNISANIVPLSIYQTTGAQTIYVSGILQNSITGANVSNQPVLIYTGSNIGNVMTNSNGIFSYTTGVLTIGSTYTPYANVSSNLYSTAERTFSNITIVNSNITINALSTLSSTGNIGHYNDPVTFYGTIVNSSSTPVSNATINIYERIPVVIATSNIGTVSSTYAMTNYSQSFTNTQLATGQFTLSTQPWTFEFFFLMPTVNITTTICNSTYTTYGSFSWNISATNGYINLKVGNLNAWTVNYTSPSKYTANVWNHLALVNTGTTFIYFYNGNAISNTATSQNVTTFGWYMSGTTFGANVYISAYRLSLIPRYLETSYTIPSPPYTVDSTTFITVDGRGSRKIYVNSANSFIGSAVSNTSGYYSLTPQNLSVGTHLYYPTISTPYSLLNTRALVYGNIDVINYQAPVTINTISINQVNGTQFISVIGKVYLNFNNTTLLSCNVLISGLDSTTITTPNGAGYFSYTSSSNLNIGQTYTPNAIVSSNTFYSSLVNFNSCKILQPAYMTAVSAYQQTNSQAIYWNGYLTNSFTGANIAGESIYIKYYWYNSALGPAFLTFSTTTASDGSFSGYVDGTKDNSGVFRGTSYYVGKPSFGVYALLNSSNTYSAANVSFANITLVYPYLQISNMSCNLTGNVGYVNSNVIVSGIVSNTSISKPIPNMSISLVDYSTTPYTLLGNSVTDTTGNFNVSTSSLSSGTHYLSGIVNTTPYYITTWSNLVVRIQLYTANLYANTITQVYNTTQVYLTGLLKYGGVPLSGQTIIVSGLSTTGNTISASDGTFTYTSSNLIAGTTYTPNISISSGYYTGTTNYNSIAIASLPANIIISNISVTSGTSNVTVIGLAQNILSGSGLAYSNIKINGLGTTQLTSTDNNGNFNYTTSVSSAGFYRANATVSSTMYAANVTSYSNITVPTISTTITANSITQVSGTTNILLVGTLTNNILGTPVTNSNIVISGLGTSTTVTSNSAGIFTYTANSLTIGTTYTPNANVRSTLYTSSLVNYSSFTVSKIPVTLNLNSLTQTVGSKTVTLVGRLTNTGLNSAVANANIIISGLGNTSTVTSNANGIFSLTASNLNYLTTYYPNANVISTTYVSTLTNLSNITVALAANISAGNVYQISGTNTLLISGRLSNAASNVSISNTVVTIGGLGNNYTTSTNYDGIFSYTSNELTVRTSYTPNATVTSSVYISNPVTLGNITVLSIPATITGTITQISGYANTIVTGMVKNTTFNTPISNVSVLIDGLGSTAITSSNAFGYFSINSNSLTIGSTYSVLANIASSTYAATSTVLGNITIAKISSTITVGSIYQVVGTQNVSLSGVLTDTITGTSISGTNILIYGLDNENIGNVTTNNSGIFNFTSSQQTFGKIYSLTANVSSENYISSIVPFSNITVLEYVTITPSTFYQIQGTNEVTLLGYLNNTVTSANIANANVLISGLGVSTIVKSASDGSFNYTSSQLITGTYYANAIVQQTSNDYYISLTTTLGDVTVTKIPATITANTTIQVNGTSEIIVYGKLTNTYLNIGVANTEIIISGLDLVGNCMTSSDGSFSYTSDSLIIGNSYYPNANIYSSVYSSSVTDLANITILPIPATITQNTITQQSGSSNIYLEGALTNTYLGSNIANITVLINGFGEVGNTITNSNGIFTYITDSKTIGATYEPNVSILSSTYIASTNTFSPITVNKIPVTIYTGNIFQIPATTRIFVGGVVKNATLNTGIPNEKLIISGFDVEGNTTTDSNGVFMYTTDSLTIKSTYTSYTNILSNTYLSSAAYFNTFTVANATISTGNIYQIPGTTNLYFDGILNDASNGYAIANANIIIEI